jgi:SAM-dependent methyltransferase
MDGPSSLPPGRWKTIVRHYERCFEEHGATPKGVDWPNPEDLEARYATQLGVLSGYQGAGRPVLLDLGCGPGLMLDYLSATDQLKAVDYRGIDLSERLISAARQRWPAHEFSVRDITQDPLKEGTVDVVIMNGVLTERVDVERSAMLELAESLVSAAFRIARVGVAFNAMSRHVDWERPDLFHWSYDELAAFLTKSVSRHYGFRADYGLFEFTTFVWRHPQRPITIPRKTWWQR